MPGKKKLDIKTLENWLWEGACKIRGEVDAPKYKDYILPIIFLKRLSDVFDDEVKKLAKDYKDKKTVEKLLEKDHSLVRFYLPPETRWEAIKKQSIDVGEYLTDVVRTIARENPKLEGVIDTVDFNETAGGQRRISDDKLKSLVDVLGRYELGLDDVEPDIIGRAYEYLLRKFAEGSGSSAGEFYTPREVAVLMAHILDPEPGERIYDPTCGSAGLLIKCYLRFLEKYGKDSTKEPLSYYGQEILHPTYAMAKMNTFIHDMEANIALGDTMNNPKFLKDDGSLRKLDLVTANPMWNQDFDQNVYENDSYNRFQFGFPPSNSADWGWIQHMYASLKPNGRIAVVLDTGSVSRGSGNQGKNRERDIRKEFVEKDIVEAVLLLPENLFYNTTAPGVVIIINKDKKHKDEVLLINTSDFHKKGKDTSKNVLTKEGHNKVVEAYQDWKEIEEVSKIVEKQEIVQNDYNLSPSRYISKNNGEEVLPLEDSVALLQEAEEEVKKTDKKLHKILNKLGLGS